MTMLDKTYRWWSFSFWSSLHTPLLSLFDPNILLRSLCLQIFRPCSSIDIREHFPQYSSIDSMCIFEFSNSMKEVRDKSLNWLKTQITPGSQCLFINWKSSYLRPFALLKLTDSFVITRDHITRNIIFN